MPFALITIGLIMVVVGARDTYSQFGTQLKSDFTGSNNFLYWVAAIGSIGALGYIQKIRPFANAFMALIIIVMVLKNGGFFQNLLTAIQQGPKEPVSPAQPASTSQTAISSGSSSNSSGGIPQTGLFGQSPETAGQGVANAYLNYLFGNY